MAAFGGGGMNPELAQLLAGGMGAPQRPKPTTAMEHIKDVYADPFKWSVARNIALFTAVVVFSETIAEVVSSLVAAPPAAGPSL